MSACEPSDHVLDIPELVVAKAFVEFINDDCLHTIGLDSVACEAPDYGNFLVPRLFEKCSDGFLDGHAFKPSWVLEVK